MKTRTCFAVIVMIVALGFGTVSVAQTGLTLYQGNPIIKPGSWDEGGLVWFPSVACQDTQYHMFYTGLNFPDVPAAIGYAQSRNGLSFSKYASAPVFEADGTGFDAYSVMAPSVLVEGDSLVLFYSGASSVHEAIAIMPRNIGRATAQSPTGPWTRSQEPVLTTGNPNEWDCTFIYSNSIVATDTGYLMFYTGGRSITDSKIGVATSPDEINWNKYGDPVVQPGDAGTWDAVSVSRAAVIKTAEGWGMYYTGTGEDDRERIGYATSHDGLVWLKHQDNPIFGADESWATERVFTGSAILNSEASGYLLYYSGGKSLDKQHIGVATEPFNRADCNEDGIVDIMDALWLVLVSEDIFGDLPISAWHCDCNGDGREKLRLLDVVCIVNEHVLGKACQVGEGKVVVSPSEAMEFEELLRPYLPAESLAELMALIKPEGQVPVTNSLAQNYPNPFNPTTSIQYSVVSDQSFPHTTLKVYNTLGQEVVTLVDEVKEPGFHTVNWDASDMASGYYFYRLTVGDFTGTRSMMLMK